MCFRGVVLVSYYGYKFFRTYIFSIYSIYYINFYNLHLYNYTVISCNSALEAAI